MNPDNPNRAPYKLSLKWYEEQQDSIDTIRRLFTGPYATTTAIFRLSVDKYAEALRKEHGEAKS